MKSRKTMQMVQIALFSGILCIVAPFTIPVPMSPVPLSLATFVVYLAGALLGAKQGTAGVLVYLLLGAVGLPVFSGFSGGIGVLFGPTGGYLIGYLPCAAIVGWLANGKKRKGSRVRTMISLLLGTMVCYGFGTAWFYFIMGESHTLIQAVTLCVVPYLLPDAVKIMSVSLLIGPLQKKMSINNHAF